MQLLNQLSIPSGTTAQRPITPAGISLRYNTTLTQLEYYNGTTWAALGSGGGSGGGSGMSTLFTDAFNNGLLDAANFGVTTGGNNVISETTELTITNDGTNGSYAAVWYKTKIPTPAVRRYTTTMKVTASGSKMSCVKSQTTMYAYSNSTAGSAKLNVWLGTGGIYSDYYNGTNNQAVMSYNPGALTVGHAYDITIDFTATQFRVTVSEPGLYLTPLAQSTLMNLNLIGPDPIANASQDWWIVFGHAITDVGSGQTAILTGFKVEG